MYELLYLLIGIFVIIAIVIIFITLGLYKHYTPEEKDPLLYLKPFTINSPWGWEGKTESAPVDGVEGECNVYTFVSSDPYSPASITFNDLNSCLEDGTCSISESQTCVDDDQIFAIKRKHRCLGKENASITSDYCLQQNGLVVPKGTIEEYYQKCKFKKDTNTSNTGKCPGALSLISFNIDQTKTGVEIFDGAMCLETPKFLKDGNEYKNLSPFFQNVCNMSATYTPPGGDPIPSQLFRVERADFDGFQFNPNQNGIYARIIHRPTNYAVTPTQSFDQNLELKPLGERKGYYWALIPALSDPDITTYKKSPPQIAYIPDPSLFPSNGGNDSLWKFVSNEANRVRSIQPEKEIFGDNISLKEKGIVKLKNFLIFEFGEQDLYQLNSTKYLNYSILPLIMKSSINFDF